MKDILGIIKAIVDLLGGPETDVDTEAGVAVADIGVDAIDPPVEDVHIVEDLIVMIQEIDVDTENIIPAAHQGNTSAGIAGGLEMIADRLIEMSDTRDLRMWNHKFMNKNK